MMDSHLFDGDFKGNDHLWACLFILMGYHFIPMSYHLAMKISRSVLFSVLWSNSQFLC